MSQVIIILLIILVPAVPFFCLLKKRKWKFWLDESSLHVQPLFWFLVFLPLIISGIAWVLVAQDYELDVSTRGYSRLMENAKFPFLVLALSPILGAFVTSAHRSLQTDTQIKATKKQIKLTEEKNQIDIYFSKRKFALEQLGLFETKYKEKMFQPNVIVDKFFKMKEEYSFEINDEYLSLFNSHLKKCKELTLAICNLSYEEEKSYKEQFLEQRARQTFLSFNEVCIKNDLYFGSVKSRFKEETKSKVDFILKFGNEFFISDVNEIINVYNIKTKKEKLYQADGMDFIYESEKYRVLCEYMDFIGNIKTLISILSMIMPEIKNKFCDFDIPDADRKINILGDNMSDIFGDKLAAETQNPPE
ncbi:hypothetical protein [Providencia rettgeri]|uniref:hypothetical protein n=1 Tax=Providencia rettgeri TaxID=587 RepID=UPI00236091B0|nr:hypothetical protein [Providencia rettgeri]